MIKIMMALGNYRFSVASAAYQQMSRSIEYCWASQSRANRRPAHQFTGIGKETISIEGTIYPQYQAERQFIPLQDNNDQNNTAPKVLSRNPLQQLKAMRAEAERGIPLNLADSKGKTWGKWCITGIEETSSEFFSNGIPRKIEFRLSLIHYGEDS